MDEIFKIYEILYQPKTERNCGQRCVAMITNNPLDVVINAVGKKGGTSTKDLKKGFESFGYTCDDNLKRFKDYLPYRCMLRIMFEKGSHWVIKQGDYIICTGYGLMKIEEYLKESKGRITSFLDGIRLKLD